MVRKFLRYNKSLVDSTCESTVSLGNQAKYSSTLLVASCDGNRDNLRLDGPLGSGIDFTHKQYQLKYCFLSQHTEYMLDVKIILTGEKPARYENSIIIMNHRCRLDWMFFWCVMARSGKLALRNEKIMMKRELKYIPGPGE